MKIDRYKLNGTIIRTETEHLYGIPKHVKGKYAMEEEPDGEWVKFKDHEKLVAFLEAQIPDRRIARLERALGLVQSGKCPECEQPVAGYQPPFGCLAPEIWATLKEQNIDAGTGHRFGCSLARSLKL
jgi:hypothetical protein